RLARPGKVPGDSRSNRSAPRRSRAAGVAPQPPAWARRCRGTQPPPLPPPTNVETNAVKIGAWKPPGKGVYQEVRTVVPCGPMWRRRPRPRPLTLILILTLGSASDSGLCVPAVPRTWRAPARSVKITYGARSDRSTNSVLFPPRVIPRPRLDFVVLLVLDLQLAVGPIELGIGRCIADVVLAAQFRRDLVEGLPQRIELVANVDHSPAGLLGEFFHVALAVVAHPGRKIPAPVGTQQYVDDRIRLLRRFNRVLNFQPAAFILTIGEQNHRLPPYLFRQHVMRGQVHSVIKHRARRRRRGDWPTARTGQCRHGDAGIDLHRVERPLQALHVARVVLQQTGIDVEIHDKRQIFVGQYLLQKRSADFFFHVEDVQLAAAGVNQDPQCKRQVRFGSEVLDGLLLAVLEDVKVIFGHVRDQRAVLVFDIEEKLHHIDVYLQGLSGLLRVVGFLVLQTGQLPRRLLRHQERSRRAQTCQHQYNQHAPQRNGKLRHSHSLNSWLVLV